MKRLRENSTLSKRKDIHENIQIDAKFVEEQARKKSYKKNPFQAQVVRLTLSDFNETLGANSTLRDEVQNAVTHVSLRTSIIKVQLTELVKQTKGQYHITILTENSEALKQTETHLKKTDGVLKNEGNEKIKIKQKKVGVKIGIKWNLEEQYKLIQEKLEQKNYGERLFV